MMTNHATLGELTQQARRAAGLTQEALATRAGLSARAISDLERNVSRSPRAATVQLLMSALSLSAHEREQFEAAARASETTSSGIQNQPTAPAREETGPGGRRRSMPDVSSRTPLIGRAAELRLVEQHLAGDGPPLLVLEGEPGIGKTRLLEEAATVAAQRGLKVLHGTVQVPGNQVPRDPVLKALRNEVERRSPVLLRRDLQGCAWLVRVLPELTSGPIEPVPPTPLSAEQESVLTVRAIVRFLTNIAGPAGTLLTLDNLHGADACALGLVAKLVESARDVPLRVIGAYRESDCSRGDALPSLLGGLAHEQLVSHVRLSALSVDESTELLRRLLADRRVTASMLDRVLRETGGVPFYLVAWGRDLLRLQAEPAVNHVPWAIRQSVRSRARAAPGVWGVLEEIGVTGGRASYQLLVALSAHRQADVLAALESASRERLVEEEGQTYGFAYGVIRSAVEADLSHTRRAVLRQRLATFLPREVQRMQGNKGPVDEPDVPDEQSEPRLGRSGASRARGANSSISDERAYHLSVLRGHRGRQPAPERPSSDI